MHALITFLLTGRDEQEGATAVEHGLLVALIAAVVIATVVVLGTQVNSAFTSIRVTP